MRSGLARSEAEIKPNRRSPNEKSSHCSRRTKSPSFHWLVMNWGFHPALRTPRARERLTTSLPETIPAPHTMQTVPIVIGGLARAVHTKNGRHLPLSEDCDVKAHRRRLRARSGRFALDRVCRQDPACCRLQKFSCHCPQEACPPHIHTICSLLQPSRSPTLR